MELLYKPDWEEAKRRTLAWWEGEALDRCALAVGRSPDGRPRGAAAPSTGYPMAAVDGPGLCGGEQ